VFAALGWWLLDLPNPLGGVRGPMMAVFPRFGQGLTPPETSSRMAYGLAPITPAPSRPSIFASASSATPRRLFGWQVMGYVPSQGRQPALWFCAVGACCRHLCQRSWKSRNLPQPRHRQAARQAGKLRRPVLL